MRIRGFTLIEMTLAVGLASALLLMEMERRALDGKERRRQALVEQIGAISEAAVSYYSDETGGEDRRRQWPTMLEQLTQPQQGRRYLNSGMANSAFGRPFKFIPAEAGDNGVFLQTDVGSAAEAELLAARLSQRDGSSMGSVVQVRILEPQSQFGSYYLLSGSRSLEGDMDVNRHSLRNVYELHVQDLMMIGNQLILSDLRSKEQPELLTTSGEALQAIHPLRYRKAGRAELGFSSAQVARLYPELVREHPVAGEGDAQRQRLFLSYPGLVSVLWSEVAHLQRQLRDLQQDMSALHTAAGGDPQRRSQPESLDSKAQSSGQ